MAAYCSSVPPSSHGEVQHMSRPYTPSPWGDFFLHHEPCTPVQLVSLNKRARELEEDVRQVILHTVASSDLVAKLELVDTLQRIGLDYHYKKEIDELLHAVYYAKDEGCDDLYTTSLRFYLLRKNGYRVFSGIFSKFRDDQGNIESNDLKALLVLYDAAHLRTRGEDILDTVISFTKGRLQSMMQNLEPELEEEVRYTLETPSYRRVERVEARHYILVYERKTMQGDTILEYAKLDYNILLNQYCEELKYLTVWWNNFKSRAYLRFARDRIVELHFWMHGVVFEPQYSYARIMLTKMLQLMSSIDDLYDNYSTTEESKIFTAAMERWDEQAAEHLPAYLQALYLNIFNTINDIVEESKLQGNNHAELVKDLLIDLARCYYTEVKWRDQDYVPTNVEEHLQISVRTSACMHITNLAFISTGATREDIEWALTYPKIIRGVCIVGRICNDIVSHEREQSSKNHVVSTVQTCMKEYDVTVDKAIEKLRMKVDEAWMDIIYECLDKKHSKVVLQKAVNLARTMDFMYKREDRYTSSFVLKDIITRMYVHFV